jgi:hypothetical protein
MKNNIAILILFTLVQISFCQTVPSKYGRRVITSGDTAESVDIPGIAIIHSDVGTNFNNAGWNHDRYVDLPSLDANKTMTIADLKGPGIIHHMHFTRHNPKELLARGLVLEIWFDDAREPAVQCPLADFFGDGCNGQSMDFSTNFIEVVPSSYNCYFPMPFKSRARILLRNDTDKNPLNYSYIEWEPLHKWDDRLGYFHATYQRRCFQLTKNSDEIIFEIKGSGHILGRQFSVVTEEPLFHSFEYVYEANNEVDIDGIERKLDYLGLEDSFTFSFGFQRPFIGFHAGITLIKHDLPSMLSVFRFHDHQPIRFTKSLSWHLNWSQEREAYFGWDKPSLEDNAQLGSKWAARVAKDGCWVDFATVFYWFQTVPGGYIHQQLPSVEERMKPILHLIPLTDMERNKNI